MVVSPRPQADDRAWSANNFQCAVEEQGPKDECEASDVVSIRTDIMDADSKRPERSGAALSTAHKKPYLIRILRSIFVESGALKYYAINFLLGYNLR